MVAFLSRTNSGNIAHVKVTFTEASGEVRLAAQSRWLRNPSPEDRKELDDTLTNALSAACGNPAEVRHVTEQVPPLQATALIEGFLHPKGDLN